MLWLVSMASLKRMKNLVYFSGVEGKGERKLRKFLFNETSVPCRKAHQRASAISSRSGVTAGRLPSAAGGADPVNPIIRDEGKGQG